MFGTDGLIPTTVPPFEGKKHPVLVLNADFRPLSYSPLSVCSWEDAVRAVFRDSVTVLAEYETVVHSPSFEMNLPSVIALREYVHSAQTPAFTRFNLFLRDNWRCQYCGNTFATHNLTFDHVIPRSRGGRTTWDNIVAACRPCNAKKGNAMPHECKQFPLKEPHRPTIYELQDHGRKHPPTFLHKSWGDFLYWDSELDN